MKQLQLHFHLQEPVIFSETAATLGGHRSLDYIPGTAVLGACASQLYGDLGNEAFAVFHQGLVRFSNAYPLTSDNQPSYPMPFALHYAKGEDATKTSESGDDYLDDQSVFNLMHTPGQKLPDNQQAKQLRTGYVSHDLQRVSAIQRLRMKTAIDPEKARAAEAQLFGYQSLEAGQCFAGVVTIDDSVSDATAEKIYKSLNNTLFLGRSRSAEYGRVDCKSVWQTVTNESITANKLTIWLQSDLALCDQYGMAVSAESLPEALAEALLPELADATSDQAKMTIDWQRSYLRYRRYSPYNAYRRAYDMERQVIEKGSVISLTLANTVTLDAQTSIGLYQAQGLGQLWINPTLLSDQHPVSQQAAPLDLQIEAGAVPDKDEIAETPLARYLQSKQERQTLERKDRKLAETLGSELKGLYDNAQKYAGVEKSILLGPSATQWGKVAEAGKQYQSNKNELFKALFGQYTNPSAGSLCDQDKKDKGKKMDGAICKPEDDDWCVVSFYSDEGQKETTFADWLRLGLSNNDIQQVGQVAAIIARMAQDYIKQQKRGGKA